MTERVTIIFADGSAIAASRHPEVEGLFGARAFLPRESGEGYLEIPGDYGLRTAVEMVLDEKARAVRVDDVREKVRQVKIPPRPVWGRPFLETMLAVGLEASADALKRLWSVGVDPRDADMVEMRSRLQRALSAPGVGVVDADAARQLRSA